MNIHIWDQKLPNYFQLNLTLDREADEIRKNLVLRVSQQRLFEALDQDCNGVLTINEFAYALQKANKTFNWDCLRRMIKQYDKTGFFYLNYRDFGTFLLSSGDNKTNENKTEIDVNQINFNLFIDLLLKELDIVQTLGDMAEDIKQTKEFLVYEAFRTIAGATKYITESNLKDYLRNKGVEVRDTNELAKIIYRYDKNFDGYFGYDEFRDIFSSVTNEKMSMSPTLERDDKRVQLATLKKLSYGSSYNNMNDETKDDSNYFSQLSKKQGLMYNYSFEKESPAIEPEMPVIANNYPEKDLATSTHLFTPSLMNPFKKNFNEILSLTNHSNANNIHYSQPGVETPLERKLNYSTMDIPLNNSLLNMSLSPNRSIAMQQHSNEKEDKDYNSSYLLSPMKEASINKQIQFNQMQQNQYQLQPPAKASTPKIVSNENRLPLLMYLKEIVAKELLCENAREEISRNDEMNMPDLFSFFDYSQGINISIDDFQESLRKLSIIVSQEEIKLLFAKYDNDHDGYLNYREFCEIILPKNYECARNLSKHIPPDHFSEFSSIALNLITSLFYSVFNCIKACESKRREMASYKSFSHQACFEMIKSKYSNTIHKEDLRKFLQDNQIIVTSYEIEILMDYFDKNRDGQICYNEFIQELSPRVL